MIYAYAGITVVHTIEFALEMTTDVLSALIVLTLVANFFLDLCTIGITLKINM